MGTSYGLSDNGWADSELFKGWLVEHFILLMLLVHALFYCLWMAIAHT